jgi:sugar/nucleoside kinase (ribokinase family)
MVLQPNKTLVACLGEALIDMFNLKKGQPLINATRFKAVPGGAPANVAIGLAKLGIKCAFIGRLGKDDFGFKLERVLSENGVDTTHILFDENTRTGLAFVSMIDENTQDFLFYRNPSADMMLSISDLDKAFLSRVSILHFGSLSLGAQRSREATYAAVAQVKKSGGMISFDVNYRRFLWPDKEKAIELFCEAIRMSDIVKVNEIEVRLISGEEDVQMGARELARRFDAQFFLTLGPEGSWFVSKRGFVHMPAFRVKTLDSTGCGDGFMAGLIASIVREGINFRSINLEKIKGALRFANAVGALVSTKLGVIPAMPTYARVARFLRNADNIEARS